MFATNEPSNGGQTVEGDYNLQKSDLHTGVRYSLTLITMYTLYTRAVHNPDSTSLDHLMKIICCSAVCCEAISMSLM